MATFCMRESNIAKQLLSSKRLCNWIKATLERKTISNKRAVDYRKQVQFVVSKDQTMTLSSVGSI